MVADMEVDKVADIVAKEIDIDINMEIQFGWSLGLVNWDHIFSTQSLSGLRNAHLLSFASLLSSFKSCSIR